MTVPSPSRFEVQGRFGGFFRDIHGKRRLALKTGTGEMYLKVPRSLRHVLKDELISGEPVVVAGDRVEDARSESGERVVTHVRRAGQNHWISLPIRVCAKKNCWRAGGREVYAALADRIAEMGLADVLSVKTVRCLDRCKRGPNVEVGAEIYHRCTPEDAVRMVPELAERS